ncbi:MAG: type II toxin-antitoxin system PemK/MazF family toxin [Deltaproteobacteria bacterium]|nr:type II toxin-antitoxin system PemK/MazF family toxin [Deltaproteobacteria bacterium]
MLRGEIYWVNLDPTLGTEIKKTRPCVVVSNNIANQNYYQITVLPITTQHLSKTHPFEVLLLKEKTGLPKNGKALAQQIRTVSKERLGKRSGLIQDEETLQKIASAIQLHLGLLTE